MGELSVNIEKWIHSFVQNLTLQVSPICNKKMSKINFAYYVDADYQMNFELISEILKDTAKKNTLDVTDAQSTLYFIERQTKFLDKFVYSKCGFLSMYHHEYINKKIAQTTRDVKRKKDTREWKAVSCKIVSLKLKQEAVNDYDETCNAKLINTVISDQKSRDLSLIEPRNTRSKGLEVTKNITACIREEAVSSKRYLQLHINDVEFMKSIHITLYIARKVIQTIISSNLQLLYTDCSIC